MPIGAIEIIAAGAASAEALAAVIPLLNGARSALIEIDNKIPGVTFRKRADRHEHGGFTVTPHSEIPSAMADVFGAQDDAFSIGTGTQGAIEYDGVGLKFYITWQVPFSGGNEIGAGVFGNSLAPARIVTHKGNGNTAAHMRYEVYPGDIPWKHRVPVPGQVPIAPNTSPTSWYTTPENVQHIAYVGTDGQIHQLFYLIGGQNQWFHDVPSASQVKVAPNTSPTSWYTTPENVQHIAYVGTDGQIHQLFHFIGGENQWSHDVPSAGRVKVAPNTSPTSWYTTPENVQHIAYVGTDEQIHQLFHFIGGENQWSHDVPSAGQVKVAPNTSPTSWYTTPENVQHIAYVGTDKQIHQCYWFIGGFGGWRHEVPSAGWPQVAPNTSPTSWYTTPENVQHIAYVGTDQQIHELFFFVQVGGDFIWHHSVPSLGKVAVASDTSPTSWYTKTRIEFDIAGEGLNEFGDLYVQHIAYVGTDKRIHELFYFIRFPFWPGSRPGDGTWAHWASSSDLTPVASGTSPTSWYTTPENVQHIAYVGADGRIHELSCFIR